MDADDLVSRAKSAYEVRDLECAEALLMEASKLRASDEIWVNLGLVRYHLGKQEEAIQAYSRATELPVEGLVNRGLCYEYVGMPDSARADYIAALELAPHDVDALVDLGTLELKEGNVQAAQRHLKDAAKIDPTANWQLSDVYVELEDLDSAARVLQAAIDAGEGRALLDLAWVESDRENYADALLLYRRAAAEGIEGAVEELAEFLESEDSDTDE